MSANSQISKNPLRLNPFVFPSDTDLYFLLLIVIIIGVSLFIYTVIYNTIFWEHTQALEARCMQAGETAGNTHPEDLSAQSGAYKQCMLSDNRAMDGTIFGGVFFLFVVAGIIYWVMPKWRIWRLKLEPISLDGDPELISYLARLCCEIGLSTHPTFVWDPLALALHGLAFGHLGRYYVYLPGGFVNKFYNDQPAFRSELLHELSHLYNKDVDKTYFTLAIW